uniref:Uncharacterized protein n=1 Tax=Arcella intermedia TaxID=1963864 RepID=A0A6B2L788_9EUKA
MGESGRGEEERTGEGGLKVDVEQRGEGSEIKDHEHDGHEHEHEDDEHYKNKGDRSDPEKPVYVVETLLATLSISIFPIFIILLVPLGKTANGKNTLNKKWLKVLLSFAVGGLLGDVFLHLLPHAMSNLEDGHHHDHDHHNHDNHEHHSHFAQTLVGVQVLGGMLLFFLIEKMALLVHSNHGHTHGKEKDKKESEDANDINTERFRIAAILNIIADIVHNFTDGMAIAASFMVSSKVGFGTTLAVLIHEIPHEIGDLAILIQTGMSKIQVVKVQFLTAVGALVGAMFGLLVGQSESSAWIIPFTAGGFIYLATADVIPQLFEKTDFTQSLKEVLSMIIGVSAMLLITFMEP